MNQPGRAHVMISVAEASNLLSFTAALYHTNMAIKTISPFKLGGALRCTATSGCLTAILVAVIIKNLAIICDQTYITKTGLFIMLGLLQICNCVITTLPLKFIYFINVFT